MIYTKEQFKEYMETFAKMDDIEMSHIAMDNLMCETLEQLGYGEGIKIFLNTGNGILRRSSRPGRFLNVS